MAEQTAPAEGEQAEPAEETERPKRFVIPPIFVRFAIIGGILAVLAVGAMFLVTDVIAPKVHTMGQPSAAPSVPKDKKKAEPGEVVTVNDLIVNPAGTGGRRYLKVAAAVEVQNAKVAKELGLRTAQLRDLFIRDLSARTMDELTDPKSKEEMRQTMVDELNQIISSGRVTNIYFTEYVVQ